MRPYSEIRVCLTAALMEGGGTTRQLAQRTGWGIGPTREALNNMARAGDVIKKTTRVPGVCRPVPVYERVVHQASDGFCTLLEAWMGTMQHESSEGATQQFADAEVGEHG